MPFEVIDVEIKRRKNIINKLVLIEDPYLNKEVKKLLTRVEDLEITNKALGCEMTMLKCDNEILKYEYDGLKNDSLMNSFISEWLMDTSPFTFPADFMTFSYTGDFNFNIDWGDGMIEYNVQTGPVMHTYSDDGIYTIKITGIFSAMSTHIGSKNRLLKIISLGSVSWKTLVFAFNNAVNLTHVNTIGLKGVVDCQCAWSGCSSLIEFNAIGLEDIKSCYGAWQNCISLKTFERSYLRNTEEIGFAWANCVKLDN